ncbi:MAG: trypco2 family protein [Kineosporiaceae bacterium]|jgi:hypothetical protein
MTHDEPEPPGLGLAQAINQVRAELEQAIVEGENSTVAFRTGSVELELEVAFAKTGGVEGGFRLSVLSFGAKREQSSTVTHRLKVTLMPVDRQGRDRLIGDAE